LYYLQIKPCIWENVLNCEFHLIVQLFIILNQNHYIMTKVFAAQKHSYGAEFIKEFNTLEELKRGIVEHELYYDLYDSETMTLSYTNDMYTEELFKKHSKNYTLFEIDLHDDETLSWSEYDGQSYFTIVKKEPEILSIRKIIN